MALWAVNSASSCGFIAIEKPRTRPGDRSADVPGVARSFEVGTDFNIT
jgi:hypothetical protein